MRARSLVIALALLLASGRGLADPAPIPEPQPPDGLPVVVTVGASELDAADLADALRRELGVPLNFDPLAKERLEIVITGRRANVTYYRAEGEPVTRSVDLPRDEQRALETIAFLAGNLARDEAAELLRQLKPEPSAETEPPPPPPEPPAPAPAPPPPAAVKSEQEKVPPKRKPGELIEPAPFAFNLSVWHPVTLLPHTEQRRMSLELGVAYSRLGALRGAALTLGYLRIDAASEGYAYATFWNRTGPFKGIQNANFFLEGHGPLTGISYADLVNFRDGDIFGGQGAGLYAQALAVTGLQGSGLVAWSSALRGLQFSGVLGYVGSSVTGAQLSGTTAVTREDFVGLQFGGLMGFTRDLTGVSLGGVVGVSRDVEGLRFGGVTTIARDVSGAQASGAFNLARDIRGVQLSTVNVARKVRGLQIGVVNVADQLDGGAIGLVNITKNGKIQPTLWYSGPDSWLNGGVKFVTGYTYTLLGAGYGAGGQNFRYEGSVGLHLPVLERGYFETGAGYAHLYLAKEKWKTTRQEARYEVRVGYEVARYLTPFAGGGVTTRLDGEGPRFRGEYFVGISAL